MSPTAHADGRRTSRSSSEALLLVADIFDALRIADSIFADLTLPFFSTTDLGPRTSPATMMRWVVTIVSQATRAYGPRPGTCRRRYPKPGRQPCRVPFGNGLTGEDEIALAHGLILRNVVGERVTLNSNRHA